MANFFTYVAWRLVGDQGMIAFSETINLKSQSFLGFINIKMGRGSGSRNISERETSPRGFCAS